MNRINIDRVGKWREKKQMKWYIKIWKLEYSYRHNEEITVKKMKYVVWNANFLSLINNDTNPTIHEYIMYVVSEQRCVIWSNVADSIWCVTIVRINIVRSHRCYSHYIMIYLFIYELYDIQCLYFILLFQCIRIN